MRSSLHSFTCVKRDKNLNSVGLTKRNKIPRLRSLEQKGGLPGEPGQIGEIILNKNDKLFYGHTGTQWEPFNGPSDDVMLNSAGGESLVVDGAGPLLEIRGLEEGVGINIDQSSPDGALIVTATGENITLESTECDNTLVVKGTGPALKIKGLSEGDGIKLANDGSPDECLKITATGENITLTSMCGSPDESLVAKGDGPDLEIKGLQAGDGIELTGDDNCVVISGTQNLNPVVVNEVDVEPVSPPTYLQITIGGEQYYLELLQ